MLFWQISRCLVNASAAHWRSVGVASIPKIRDWGSRLPEVIKAEPHLTCHDAIEDCLGLVAPRKGRNRLRIRAAELATLLGSLGYQWTHRIFQLKRQNSKHSFGGVDLLLERWTWVQKGSESYQQTLRTDPIQIEQSPATISIYVYRYHHAYVKNHWAFFYIFLYIYDMCTYICIYMEVSWNRGSPSYPLVNKHNYWTWA